MSLFAYKTPGVYYEPVDANAGGITTIRTDVTAFVGIAEQGPIDVPVPLESWRQFLAHFGSFTGQGFLAYAVRAFFENGGQRCWVVRVASLDNSGGAAAATTQLQNAAGSTGWRINASSPGLWGNNLTVTFIATSRAQTKTIPDLLANPNDISGHKSIVASTSGFERGTLVRLIQGTINAWRVVSEVDAVGKHLVWVNNDPRARLPYEQALSGFKKDEPIFVKSLEYTLVVRLKGRPIGLYEGLSLIPEHDNYGSKRLTLPLYTEAVKTQHVIPAAPPPVVIEEMREGFDLKKNHFWRQQFFLNAPLDQWLPLDVKSGIEYTLENGRDGLTQLTYYDFMGEESSPLDSELQQRLAQRGIRVLKQVSEVAMVAVPDIHIRPYNVSAKSPLEPCVPDPCLPGPYISPATPRTIIYTELPPVFSQEQIFEVQAALVQHCEDSGDRIALLDPPYDVSQDDELGVGAIRAWRKRFESKYAALFYPWIKVVDPLRNGSSIGRDLPPSGHVAGQYAKTDVEIGVHKAGANDPLVWLQDATVRVNEIQHGILNEEGINVIRVFTSRGIRIYGARTVSNDMDWRFVNVQRLLMMIKKAIYLSIQWAVFEPNDIYTRNKLRLVIFSFLLALWQRGALMGDSAEEAFFVKCDEENNPPSERDLGRLVVEVGVAPSKPFEFIVLRVGRTGNEFEITESLSNSRGM